VFFIGCSHPGKARPSTGKPACRFEFGYEPKWDGFCCLAVKFGHAVDLGMRSGRPAATSRRAGTGRPVPGLTSAGIAEARMLGSRPASSRAVVRSRDSGKSGPPPRARGGVASGCSAVRPAGCETDRVGPCGEWRVIRSLAGTRPAGLRISPIGGDQGTRRNQIQRPKQYESGAGRLAAGRRDGRDRLSGQACLADRVRIVSVIWLLVASLTWPL